MHRRFNCSILSFFFRPFQWLQNQFWLFFPLQNCHVHAGTDTDIATHHMNDFSRFSYVSIQSYTHVYIVHMDECRFYILIPFNTQYMRSVRIAKAKHFTESLLVHRIDCENRLSSKINCISKRWAIVDRCGTGTYTQHMLPSSCIFSIPLSHTLSHALPLHQYIENVSCMFRKIKKNCLNGASVSHSIVYIYVAVCLSLCPSNQPSCRSHRWLFTVHNKRQSMSSYKQSYSWAHHQRTSITLPIGTF